MTNRLTAIPAYGRDYKSKAAVAADYHANKDFIIQDFFSGQDGRAVNKQDAANGGVKLSIRYDRLTKVVTSDELDKIKVKHD